MSRAVYWSILAVTLSLSLPDASAQTIHKDDLKYFRGMLFVYDLALISDTVTIDSLLDWAIVRPDTTIVKPNRPDQNRGLHTWYYEHDEQQHFSRYFPWWKSWHHRPPKEFSEEYRYVMLSGGACSSGVRSGLLTRWDVLGDSLRLVCTMGNASMWMGLAAVRRVLEFPDNSHLVVVEHSALDTDTFDMGVFGGHVFLRVDSCCVYDILYSSPWAYLLDYLGPKPQHLPKAHGICNHRFCCLDNLVLGNYRITEVTEWYTDTLAFGPLFSGKIDSVTTEIVDLWRVAVKKCDIDTTAISSDNH